MMRPKPVSSLQKTYDDCYLMCSTAVYFEGQNNEDEALRSWRSALETIYYHNAYRLPASYTPSNETERALQQSIRQLELQCRERVDLLDALRESRKEKEKEKEKKEKEANKGKDSSSSSISSLRKFRFTSTPRGSNANGNATPGFIGDGTVPAVGYNSLSKPPAIPQRPLPATLLSDYTLPTPPPPPAHATPPAAASAAPTPPVRPAAARADSQTSTKSSSRTPSPDRRKMLSMPSTLRDPNIKKKKKDSSRRKDLRPVAASQAAGLAWGSIPRHPSSEKSASDAAVASSRHTVTNELQFRRDLDARNEFPSLGAVDPGLTTRPDLSKYRRDSDITRAALARIQSADEQLPRKSPVKTMSSSSPGTPPLKRTSASGPRQYPGNRSRASQSPTKQETIDASRPVLPPKPIVKPKPVTLKTNQPSAATSQPRTSSERDRTVPGLDVVHGLDNMGISGSPVRRKPNTETKRPITPPSSDPDTQGRKSLEVDEDDHEDEDEDAEGDSFIEDVMKKLPRGVDPTAARQVLNDIVVRGDEVHWDDIAGLEGAKKALKEAVVYPFLRPDLFSGLREPARGMLLFGPPGTGKTMLARAVATESKSTFFSVSASTLTSKWHGESEKLVRALFGLAKALAPSIIFVDEIDSLLSARSSGTENEASRRSKTEFLIQWSDLQRAAAGREPLKSGDASRVLVLAATNMPWDIDEAARRRFVRRQYIPLPEHHVRAQQLRKLLGHQVHDLDDEDIEVLVHVTESFSGSDVTALAKDAAMGPLRNLGEALLHTPMDQIRPICFADFEASLLSIRPSVSQEGLRAYEDWARQFGERGG
ncbi:putative AAA family ATPase [Aspergillus stella-maris]|uniref:putative AAA family ATPase n=1 Tax=Aspergillus stella-maris TaxID=1810926 RepID=UPI003CCDC336